MGRCTTLVPVPRGFSIHNNCQARPHWNPMVYIWMGTMKMCALLDKLNSIESHIVLLGCDRAVMALHIISNTDCCAEEVGGRLSSDFTWNIKWILKPLYSLPQLNDTIKIKLITPHENFETRQGTCSGSRSKARTRMKMTVTPPGFVLELENSSLSPMASEYLLWHNWAHSAISLSIIYYHNQERARKIHTVRNGEYILGKCHTIIRPCLSSTVLGSSKCPNWGLIKNLASSAVSSSPSGWGRLFFTRSAIRVTSHSVWSVPNKY